MWQITNEVTITTSTPTGVISTINTSTNSWVLTSSNNTWVPGNTVRSPNRVNTDGTTLVYAVIADDGFTVSGISVEPTIYPFAPTPISTSMILYFPETWDDGMTPDEELPNGTTLFVDMTATNSQGESTGTSEPLAESLNVLTFNADSSVVRMTIEENIQLKLNAATYEVRCLICKKNRVHDALLQAGYTQTQIDNTYL